MPLSMVLQSRGSYVVSIRIEQPFRFPRLPPRTPARSADELSTPLRVTTPSEAVSQLQIGASLIPGDADRRLGRIIEAGIVPVFRALRYFVRFSQSRAPSVSHHLEIAIATRLR
jgi:hypothetical protein